MLLVVIVLSLVFVIVAFYKVLRTPVAEVEDDLTPFDDYDDYDDGPCDCDWCRNEAVTSNTFATVAVQTSCEYRTNTPLLQSVAIIDEAPSPLMIDTPNPGFSGGDTGATAGVARRRIFDSSSVCSDSSSF